MRNSSKLFVAVAAAGLVAASGSAFTAGNTLNGDNVAGYGTDVVSGATTEVIEHTLDAPGTGIVSTKLVFATNLTANETVKAGFGSSNLELCDVTLDDAASAGKDTAVCTYASAYDTATSTAFNVAVN